MRSARVSPVLLLTVIACLGLVLLVNLTSASKPTYQQPVVPIDDDGLAPSYSQLRAQGPRANAHFESRLETLRPPEQALTGSRAEALAARRQQRAFDGAPPVVPHAVDQQAPPNCLACHENGLRVGDRLAPKVSHPQYSSCLQCHATNSDRPTALVVVNSFAGKVSNTLTPAFPSAPPQMPHGTWMRQDCLSCHGPSGQPGLRSSHPDRLNCLQCHTPAATAQRPFLK